jgi:hypothetical protein
MNLKNIKISGSSTPEAICYGLLFIIILIMFLWFSDVKSDDSLIFRPDNVVSGKWDISCPYLINGSWKQQEVICNMWKISNHDKEFIKMCSGENGLFTSDRKSDVPNEDSWGYCQINRKYHKDIVDDPRFFKDPIWQLQKCYELWKSGTRFYGYDSKWLTIKKFIW